METTDSAAYWEKRYAGGHTSGVGSYGRFAAFKAEFLNRFVAAHGVRDVIEFGCGDGAQLSLANYPSYLGYDVSATVLDRCREKFAGDATKRFRHASDTTAAKADLTLSLDVVYHLVEDDVFDLYMKRLFDSAVKWVIIYSSNHTDNADLEGTYIKHRRFTDWVEAYRSNWSLVEKIDNPYPYLGDYRTGSFADFYVYERRSRFKVLFDRFRRLFGD